MYLKLLRLALVTVATALALIAIPSDTVASCRLAPDIKTAVLSADIVFVGTVTATSNRDGWVTVAVEEVWRGPDQAAEVVIKAGSVGNLATSVDRTFEVGVKYLFFPYADPAVGLSDNSCSSTTPWSDDLLALRPSDARTPLGATAAETGFDLGGLLGPLAVAAVVAGVLLAVGLLARSRQPG